MVTERNWAGMAVPTETIKPYLEKSKNRTDKDYLS